jgi:t-SNARE complex subunit (syntaxin)
MFVDRITALRKNQDIQSASLSNESLETPSTTATVFTIQSLLAELEMFTVELQNVSVSNYVGNISELEVEIHEKITSKAHSVLKQLKEEISRFHTECTEKSATVASSTTILNHMQVTVKAKIDQYLRAQLQLHQIIRSRKCKDLKLLLPSTVHISDQQIQQAVDRGLDTQELVQRLLTAPASFIEDGIESDETGYLLADSKFQAYSELEKQMFELRDIFIELSALVNAQGEMMDSIEKFVSQTKTSATNANKALKKTRDKKEWWLRFWFKLILTVILLLLVIILIYKMPDILANGLLWFMGYIGDAFISLFSNNSKNNSTNS